MCSRTTHQRLHSSTPTTSPVRTSTSACRLNRHGTSSRQPWWRSARSSQKRTRSKVCMYVWYDMASHHHRPRNAYAMMGSGRLIRKLESVAGNKKDNITIIYTPWSNLLKTAGMATGQVSFHEGKKVCISFPLSSSPIPSSYSLVLDYINSPFPDLINRPAKSSSPPA